MTTVGSLCTGYGGLDDGVPGGLSFVAETEAAARIVLDRRFPDVPNVGDVTSRSFAGSLSPVDVLTAGFPCQPVSWAGHGHGEDDKRWLWLDVRAAIRTLSPPVVFLENVLALVTADGGRLHQAVLRDLQYEGYRVRWAVVGGCSVWAPHHRHRWFAYAEKVRGVRYDPVQLRMPCPGRSARLLPTPTVRDGISGPGHSVTSTGGRNLRTVALDLRDGWGRYESAIRAWEDMLGRAAPPVFDPGPRMQRMVSGRFAEWMMGLPEGLVTAGLSRPASLRLAGNGVMPRAAEAAWRLLAGALPG